MGRSKYDWEKHKETICELYPKMKLEDLMQEMKTRGFHAKKAVYKAKFIEWGLCKGSKKMDMMFVVAKGKKREEMGKETEFFIRGKQVLPKEIRNFALRNKQEIQDVRHADLPTPKGVTYRSPRKFTFKLTDEPGIARTEFSTPKTKGNLSSTPCANQQHQCQPSTVFDHQIHSPSLSPPKPPNSDEDVTLSAAAQSRNLVPIAISANSHSSTALTKESAIMDMLHRMQTQLSYIIAGQVSQSRELLAISEKVEDVPRIGQEVLQRLGGATATSPTVSASIEIPVQQTTSNAVGQTDSPNPDHGTGIQYEPRSPCVKRGLPTGDNGDGASLRSSKRIRLATATQTDEAKHLEKQLADTVAELKAAKLRNETLERQLLDARLELIETPPTVASWPGSLEAGK